MKINSNDFYKKFNCDNKEDLYKKILNKDPEVKSLIDYYNYKVNKRKNNKISFNNPEIVVEHISTLNKSEDTFYMILLNTKLNPEALIEFNLNDYDNTIKYSLYNDLAKDMLKEYYLHLNDKVVFVNFTNNKNDMENFKKTITNYFDYNMNNVIDIFTGNLDYDYFYSFRNGHNKIYPIEKKEFSILIDNEEFDNEEFSAFYSEKENLNLNLIYDFSKISNNLKVGFDEFKREQSGIIIHDENYNILDQKVLFSGGISYAPMDKKIILHEVLHTKKASGFIVFHNHPSGSLEPSKEDLLVTQNISKDGCLLDIPLTDHIIISKEGINSLLSTNREKFSVIDEHYLYKRIYEDKVEEKKEKPKFNLKELRDKHNKKQADQLFFNEKNKMYERGKTNGR